MYLYAGKLSVIQYADDSQLLICGKKSELPAMIRHVEASLAELVDWFCQNDMKINMSKTQLLVLGTKAMLCDVPQITIHVGTALVTETKSVKNLGLVIDKHLTFEHHVDQLTAKCTGMLMALMHAKHVVPRCTLRQIVESLVISSIRYCISIYGTCGTTQMHRVQKLVNFCIRVITGKRKYESVSREAERLRILSARNLADYHELTLVKSTLRFGEPEALREIFEYVAHGRETRQSGQLRLPRVRSEIGKRRISFRGAKLFNEFTSK